jgi:hypothetical protein
MEHYLEFVHHSLNISLILVFVQFRHNLIKILSRLFLDRNNECHLFIMNDERLTCIEVLYLVNLNQNNRHNLEL